MYDTLNDQDWTEFEAIWDLLDEGEVERARAAVAALARRRPGHPDIRIVDAAVAIDENRAAQALEALRGAESSADPALFFHLRSMAHFHVLDIEKARQDAEQALCIRPTFADPHALLCKIHDFLGDPDAAGEHAAEANELDPEAFPMPLELADEQFDQLVERSLAELPAPVRRHLEEIPVLVEPMPPRAVLAAESPPFPPDILGLFVGRHLLDRRHDDLPGAPGAIYLFRRNLLRFCRDAEELEREVRVTVLHEVGHLLGLDEDDLESWGLA